jgi:two-component system, NarL family, response regulator LiaR
MQPIRVMIADDHPVFRRGMRIVCQNQVDLEMVGEASNGQEALDMARRLKPDVILMDIHMPVMNGIQAAQQITSEQPETGIIILTVTRDDEHVFSAIKAGARGYLLKDSDETTLIQAIYAIQRGEALIDPNVAARVLDEFRRMSETQLQDEGLQQLSEVELQILRLLAQGKENSAIAQQLYLSEKTVVNRLSTIYQKLHVNNRTQAALYALRQGLAPLTPED